MYQNNAKRSATGEVKLSYVHLNEPYVSPANPTATPKFSTTILIPKSDVATKTDIENAIKAAYEDGVQNIWKGARPAMRSTLIHDGDGLRENGTPFGPECKGHWVLTASSARKPGVYDINNINSPLMPQDVYSGMYARVTLSFYNPKSGNPVACSLDNVFKTRDGEPLSGGPSAAQDLAGLGITPVAASATTANINPITGLPM